MSKSGSLGTVLVCLLAASGVGRGGVDVQRGFEALFGADARAVEATATPADDVELANRLLAAVPAAAEYPAMQHLLHEKAYAFGLRSPDGYASSAAAMKALAKAAPERSAECGRKLLEVYQLAYARASSADKPAAGQRLLGALIAAGDREIRTSAAEAGALYRRALSIATYIKSDRRAEVQLRIKAATLRQAVEQRLQMYIKRLEFDPTDLKVRMDLIRFYIVEMDNPAGADKLLTDETGEVLATYVPLAELAVEKVAPPACLELAQWYESYAREATNAGKGIVYARSKAYYERFLSQEGGEEMARLKATISLERVKKALERYGPSEAADPAEARWVSLLTSPTKLLGWRIGWQSTDYHARKISQPVAYANGVVSLTGHLTLYHSKVARDQAVRAAVSREKGAMKGGDSKGALLLALRCGPRGRYFASYLPEKSTFNVGKRVISGNRDDSSYIRSETTRRHFGGTCEMMFTAVGKKLTLYVNGEKIIEVEDSTLTTGSVGIGVYRLSGQFRKVEMLLPPPGWKPDVKTPPAALEGQPGEPPTGSKRDHPLKPREMKKKEKRGKGEG
jgi:hypothetical protein